MANVSENIAVSDSGYALPVEDLLTGRGAIFGKSGSGKSNTATVVAEELLNEGLPLMIVDQDGEYYGLRDEYDMLHVGANDECDRIVGSEDAEHVADIALEDNTPVILDVSGYVEEEVAREIVELVIRRLFQRENDLMKPFLLLVEEIHEYIPEQGGHDDLGDMLIRVAKRGRKRGLGICGISQRPASVSKDFITQCDWLVWHRLTWDNDTKVVGRILGSEYSERVTELRNGEAYVMTDWDEEVRRIRFRLKRTAGGGGTPGLENLTDVGSASPETPATDGDAATQSTLPADGTDADAGVQLETPPADVDALAADPVEPADPAAGTDPARSTAGEPGREQERERKREREVAPPEPSNREPQAAAGPGDDPAADPGSRGAGPSKPNPPRRVESHEGNVVWEFSQMTVYLLSLMAFQVARGVRFLAAPLLGRIGGGAGDPADTDGATDTRSATDTGSPTDTHSPTDARDPTGTDDPRRDAAHDPLDDGWDADGGHHDVRYDRAASERFDSTGHLNWVRFSMVLVSIIVVLLVGLAYVLLTAG